MDAIRQPDENASNPAVDARDARALTEYLTVLDDVGRARGGEGLYLVVSHSGREYLVDADQGACECEDFRYRGVECKHVRRVAFATGDRAIPTTAAIELDVDPSLGEHVGGEHRYISTDGGDAVRDAEPEQTREDDHGDGSWFVRDRDRDKIKEYESRAAAERAVRDLEDLGLDVELVSETEIDADLDRRPGDDDAAAVPDRVQSEDVELRDRSLADDPQKWLPDAFVDWIDGTPAINRKGFEVLAHFYHVDVETEIQVGPADTDHEFCQVKATATMPGGRRCEALASAHVDRGDDPTLLLELADTRARKRAISIATGVGIVAVEELRSRPEHA